MQYSPAISIGGVMSERVVIVDYDPQWPERFAAERARIAAALREVAVRIDHNGSTSVPGLPAKPVIDIQISVAGLHPMDPYRTALQALGYTHVPHADDRFCPFFHKPAQWPHTHHVHVVELGGSEEKRTLAFRDWLRDHADDRAAYAGLKRRLAEEFTDPGAQNAYAAAKGDFIERTIAQALAAGYPHGL
ncbi:MAG TPA: GrpB family protein [Pseudomonadales bacterium]|nr:GrpB family protein [Pseudomonadales bacterium]